MKNPIMLPKLDFDDQIPTRLPSDFTLKWRLNIVISEGKKDNWQKPNKPKLTKIIKYVAVLGCVSVYYPLNNDTIGTTLNANAVGMAVFRHTRVLRLSLIIEYLKNVPILNVMNISESNNPKNRSPIPNLYSIWCLLNEYVIRIIWIVAYMKNVRM